MIKNNVLYNYISYLVMVLIAINLLHMVVPIISERYYLEYNSIFRVYMPYLIGIIFAAKMLIDRGKLRHINLPIYVGVITLTIFSYSTGVILLLLTAIISLADIKNEEPLDSVL